MASLTVTATSVGPNTHAGMYLLVRVFTGATESGGATASGTPVGSTGTVSLTPNGTNSLVFASVCSGLVAGSFSAASNNTTYFNVNDGTNTATANWAHFTGAVTSGTPVAVGATLAGSSTIANGAYEILSTTGSTPSLATSPTGAQSPSTNTVTSASFTAVPGAVLCVGVGCTSPSGTGVSSFTVSDSLGVAWTSRVFQTGSPDAAVGVFTGTVPPPPPAPTTLYQMRSFG